MIKATFHFFEKKNNSFEIIFIISLSANIVKSVRIKIDLKKKLLEKVWLIIMALTFHSKRESECHYDQPYFCTLSLVSYPLDYPFVFVLFFVLFLFLCLCLWFLCPVFCSALNF